MPLLGGNKSSLRSNPRAAAPRAQDVRPKVQGSGKVNLAKLRAMQERHTLRGDFYKLQQDGTSRFRLVLPLGGDDLPMVIADQHFLPVANETGKTSKKAVYCMNAFGIDCPICRLSAMLQNSNDADLIADGQDIRAARRWAMLVVNRDYMAGSDDPMTDYDPKKEKIVTLYAPSGIGDDIADYMNKKVWSDPQDPETGYDFEVLGKKKGGSSPWPEYTLTPQPRDVSPAYDINLTKGLKPLSQVVTPNKIEDIDKILIPILMSLAESGEDGAEIVESFQELWNDFKTEHENGIVVPESMRDVDPGIDDAEAYVEEPVAAPQKAPARVASAAKPAARKPEPAPEPEEEYIEGGEGGETEEGYDPAPEGGESEGEEYDPGEGTGEGEEGPTAGEEEPEQPVARPAPKAKTPAASTARPAPVAKPAATGVPGIRRPGSPAPAAPAPAAKGMDMKSRLANVGKK